MQQLLQFVTHCPETVEVYKFCSDHGIDINSTNENGSTALHGTAAHRLIESTRVLLDLNANPFIRDKIGNTPLDLAISGGSIYIASMILKFAQQSAENLPEMYLERSLQLARGRINHMKHMDSESHDHCDRLREVEELVQNVISIMKIKDIQTEHGPLEEISEKIGIASSKNDLEEMLSMFDKLNLG